MDKRNIEEAFSTLSIGYKSIDKSLLEGNFSDEVFLAGEKSSKIFAAEEEEHHFFLGLIRSTSLMGVGLLIQTRYFPATEKFKLALSSLTNLENLVIPWLVHKETYQKEVIKLRVFIIEYLIDALKELETLEDIPRLYQELFSIKEKEKEGIQGEEIQGEEKEKIKGEIGRLALKMAVFEFKNKNYSLAIDHCNRAEFGPNETYHSLLKERLLFLTNILWKPQESSDPFHITRLLERFDLFNNWVEIEFQFVEVVMSIEGLWDVERDPDHFRLIFQAETILKELENKADKATQKIRLIAILVKHARWHFSMKDIFNAKEVEDLAVRIYSLIKEHVHVKGFIEVFKNVLEELIHLTLDIAKKCANVTFLKNIALILDQVLPLAPVGLKGKILYLKRKLHSAMHDGPLVDVHCLDTAMDFLIETHGESHPLIASVTVEKTKATKLVQNLLV